MTLFKKNEDYGYDFILTKHFRWFTDCGDWFIYVDLPLGKTIRLSSAGYMFYRR